MPLKHRVAAHRASLAARALEPGHDGLLLSQHNAAFLQQILRETFESLHLTGAPVALVAVGSLGRGAVTACADVDVRLLTHSGHDVSALAESMLYPLWDAGLNVGHQVVSDTQIAPVVDFLEKALEYLLVDSGHLIACLLHARPCQQWRMHLCCIRHCCRRTCAAVHAIS